MTEIIALSISALAILTTFVLELDRRRRESTTRRLTDRRAVYAAFLSFIVRWQHAVVAEAEERVRASGGTSRALETARQNLRVAKQEAMTPLFELRMVGGKSVVEIGERVVDFNYLYEKLYREDPDSVPSPHPQWIEVRDAFIAAVRDELGIDADLK